MFAYSCVTNKKLSRVLLINSKRKYYFLHNVLQLSCTSSLKKYKNIVVIFEDGIYHWLRCDSTLVRLATNKKRKEKKSVSSEVVKTFIIHCLYIAIIHISFMKPLIKRLIEILLYFHFISFLSPNQLSVPVLNFVMKICNFRYI